MTFNTYRDRAEAAIALEAQGRHAAAAKATVTGTQASVRYPRLPADNPFTTDISGVEPPTGIDINWQEPNGNYHEIEASLAAQPTVVSLTPDGSAEVAPADFHSSGAQAPSVLLPLATEGANSNVIADPPSDNPTNAEVGGEAGRGDVGPGVHGDACTGTTSPLLRRGRKL